MKENCVTENVILSFIIYYHIKSFSFICSLIVLLFLTWKIFLLCFQTTVFFHASVYVHSTSPPNCTFKLRATASYDTVDCSFFFDAAATINGSVSGKFFVSNALLVALRKIVWCAWPTENTIKLFPGKR